MTSSPSIFIVEDESIIASYIGRTLESRGYRVAGTAANGEDALERVEILRPDLILMDIILSGPMSGIDTAERLKGLHDIPVVYLTGNPEEKNLSRVKETEPYGYILKPANASEIISAVEIALYKHSMERKLRESEERFRTVVESATDGICVIRDELIRYVNPALLRIIGYSQEERSYDDQPFSGIIHPDEMPLVLDMHRRFMEGKDPEQNYQTALTHRNGGRVEVDIKTSWMEDYNGQRAVLVFIRDISAQKKAQEELKASEERFRVITENAPFGTVISEFDGSIVYVNRMAEIVFGTSRESVMGRMSTLDFWIDISERDKFMEPLLRDGRIMAFETMLRKWDGEPFRALIYSNIISYDGRRVILSVFQDITDFVDAQRKLRLTRFALDHAGETALWMEPGGGIVYCNDAAVVMLGYGRNEFAGLTIFDIDANMTAEIWHARRGLRKDKKSYTNTTEYRTRGGALVPVEVGTNYLDFEEEEYVITFIRDISDRIRAEEELFDSRRRLYEIIQFLPVATFAVDRAGKVIAWNRAMEELTGVPEGNMLGEGDMAYAVPFYGTPRRMLVDFVLSGTEDFDSRYESAKREGDSAFAESKVLLRDGRRIWLWGKASPLYDSRGEIAGAIESIQDITERKQAEEKIRLSEEKFYKAFMASPLAVILFDMLDGRFLEVNDRFFSFYGYTRDELIGRTPDDMGFFVNDDDRDRIQVIIRNDRALRDYELAVRRKDGIVRHSLISGESIMIEGRECFIAIAVDITEMKTLQKEMATAIEEERQRIGRNLHDDLGQVLTGATFLLQSLKEDLASRGESQVEDVKKIEGLVRNAVVKTRNISRILSPVEIVENDLIAALEEMALQVEKIFIISCQVHCDDEVTIKDNLVATNLFYIIREAVTNALKHSYANRIDIQVRLQGDALMVSVRDDGVGVVDHIGAKGLGLRIMKYRAGLIGANVAFSEAGNGRGFEVRISLKFDDFNGTAV